MRRPSSFLFWFVAIVVVAALAQGGRELTSLWRGGPGWDGAGWSLPWSRPGLRRPPSGEPPAAPGTTFSGRASVIDGDSLEVAGARVRLSGIDAPERYQQCRDAAGRDYACGRLAARALAAFIAGRSVACTSLDHDRYERDVARCTVEGRDLGEAMVASGQAIELPQFSRGRYTVAEREARAQKRGLWAGTFEQPAAWRHSHAR